jgi:uncharacterized protein (DUF433 family)
LGTSKPAALSVATYLAAGESLDTFLDDFPSVRREQALALLALSRDLLPGQEAA